MPCPVSISSIETLDLQNQAATYRMRKIQDLKSRNVIVLWIVNILGTRIATDATLNNGGALVELWDAPTGQKLWEHEKSPSHGMAKDICFSEGGKYLVFRIMQNYSSKLHIVDAISAIHVTAIELSSVPPAIAFAENGSRLGVVIRKFSEDKSGVVLQDEFQPIQDSLDTRANGQPQVLSELVQDVVETSGESRHPAMFYSQGGSRVFLVHWQREKGWPTLEVSGWDVITRQIVRHISYSGVHLDPFMYESTGGYADAYQVNQEYLAVLGYMKRGEDRFHSPTSVTMIFSLCSDEQLPETTLENTIVNGTISDGFLFIRENALRLWKSNVREEVMLGKLIYGNSRLSQGRASAMVLCEGGRQLIVYVGRLEVFERSEN